MLERKFQKFVKTKWNGYSIQLHPGIGSDVGIPDLFLGYSSGLIPCELKIGSLSDNFLRTTEVRPSQIAWHFRHANAGYESIFLVGVPQPENNWRLFVIDGLTIQGWDSDGFEINKDTFEINIQNFQSEIEDFIERL